jgi:hypothetical protein
VTMKRFTLLGIRSSEAFYMYFIAFIASSLSTRYAENLHLKPLKDLQTNVIASLLSLVLTAREIVLKYKNSLGIAKINNRFPSLIMSVLKR